jgi:hypothetical protein
MIRSQPWCHDTHTRGKESVWEPFHTNTLIEGNLATADVDAPPQTLYASYKASSLIIRVGYPTEAGRKSNLDSGMLLSQGSEELL